MVLMLSLVACASIKKPKQDSISYPRINFKTKTKISKQKKVSIKINAPDKKTKVIWSQAADLEKSKLLYQSKAKQKSAKIKVDLEYRETDIGSVIKQILGDTLHLNYTIHPRVKGVLNLKISGEYTKTEILDALKQTLSLLGIELLYKNGIYEIIPVREGLKFGLGTSNFAFLIYVPSYVTPRDIQMVIKPFTSPQGKIFVNNRKNYLIVEDTFPKIKSIANLIKVLDVDVLQHKYVKIYKLEYSEAKDVARDITSFMNGIGVFRNDAKYSIIPIQRLNYLIVIASNQKIMNRLDSIIKILDAKEKSAKRDIYIYKAQYVKAKQLANTLIAFFSGKTKITTKKTTVKTRSRISSSLLSEEVVIIPDETTNYLLIQATPADYAKIMQIIKMLDAMPRQVLIEVLIAEVSLNDGFEHGIEWWLKKNKGEYSISSGIQYGLAGAQSSLLGFTYYGIKPDDFWNFLYFLDTKSSLQVISSPHITVRNNSQAYINVGSEVPIATGETIGNVQTNGTSAIERRIQYKNVGTILTITPHISEDGFVTMEIDQEVSDAKSNTVSGIDSPIISTRKTKTTLMVQDNHSIVIGGIIKRKKDTTIKSIPLLGDLPVLGNLFSYRSTQKENTELIIMITPHVIRSPQDADIITNIFQNRLEKLKKANLIQTK